MALGASADDWLTDGIHLDCRLNAGMDAKLFKRVLHGERVHDRCEHPHIIGLSTVHALCSARHPAKNITAANNKAQFKASILGRFDFASHPRNGFGINTELPAAHQRLSR